MNNQGKITKQITAIDKEKGKVTIAVKIENFAQEEEEKFEDTELLIIIPESISEGEDLSKYSTYINTLATKIFRKNAKTKIGIVGMKGTINDSTKDENGNMILGANDESDIDGTEKNAEIVVNFTNDATILKNGIMNMNKAKTKYRYNLQAALKLAKNTYSKNVNKILITLYDNVPNIAIGIHSKVSYGGWNSQYETAEEAIVAKHKALVSKTKAEILELKENNIDFIMLRPEDTSFDQKWYKATTGEPLLDFDGSPYVRDLYGTLENPTYGKMYSLNDASLEKVVTEHIYNDIIEKVGIDMQEVSVKDYFPEEITKNFTISISNNNQEEVDASHLNERYIVWNIGELKSNQSKTLTYTLQITDMNNSELLEKVISTNEKVELTYKAGMEEVLTVNLTSSPKIKLSKQVVFQEDKSDQDNKGNQNKQGNTIEAGKLPQTGTDHTKATGKLPQTGVNTTIIFGIITMGMIGGILYKKMKGYKDIK